METFRRIAKVIFQTSPGPHRNSTAGRSAPPTLCGHTQGRLPPRRGFIAPGVPSCEDSGGKRRANGLSEPFGPTLCTRISLSVEKGAAANSGRPSPVNRRRAAGQSPSVDRLAPEK